MTITNKTLTTMSTTSNTGTQAHICSQPRSSLLPSY